LGRMEGMIYWLEEKAGDGFRCGVVLSREEVRKEVFKIRLDWRRVSQSSHPISSQWSLLLGLILIVYVNKW